MPHHDKLAHQPNLNLNKQNKKILLYIFRQKPDLVKKILENYDKDIFGQDSFSISEESLKRKFNIVLEKEPDGLIRVEPNCIVEVYEKERQEFFSYQYGVDCTPDSPVGKKLIYRKVGETVKIDVNGKTRTLEIIEIKPNL